MKKYVRLTLCCAAAVMLASGCGKKSDTAEETTTAASETQAEITDKGEVTKLGQYKGVEVTKQDTTVTEADLDQRIASILKANPEVTEITDRPAQKGDTVNIDYVGMKDGEAFDGGTAEGYDLELGSGVFIDGFEDGLIGANTGEERSLNLTFPEDYTNADLAGQAVFLQYCCQFSSNQTAGSGVDGWSSNFEAEAGKRHRSYSFTSPEQEGGGRGLPSL